MTGRRRAQKTLYKHHHPARARAKIHARTWAWTAIAATGIMITILACAWLVVDFAIKIITR